MLLWLGLNCLGDNLFQFLRRGADAQRLAQVNLVVTEQAGAELTFGSKAEAITTEAEVLADWRDEADGAAGLRKAKVSGRTVSGYGQAGLQLPQPI